MSAPPTDTKIQIIRTGNEMPFTLMSTEETNVGNAIGIPRAYRSNGNHDNKGYDFYYILKYVLIAVIGIVAIFKTMNTENKLLKWGVRIISVGGIALSSMALLSEVVRMESKFSMDIDVIRGANKKRVEDVIDLIETSTGVPVDVDLIDHILQIDVAKLQKAYDSTVKFKDSKDNRCTFNLEDDGNCSVGYTRVTYKDRDETYKDDNGKDYTVKGREFDCCDLNDPEGVDPAIFWKDMGLMLLKEIAIGVAFEMIAKRVLSRVAVLGSQAASKLIAVMAKKFASKALAKLATKAAALSVKACMGPIGWVLGIFDAVSMVSDILDFNGYNNFLENTKSQVMRNVTLRSEQTNTVSNGLDYPQCFPLRLAFESEFDAAMMKVNLAYGEIAFKNVMGDINDKDWYSSVKPAWGDALITVIDAAIRTVSENVAKNDVDTFIQNLDYSEFVKDLNYCDLATVAGIDNFCTNLNEAMENELLRVQSENFETRDRMLYEDIKSQLTREDIEKIEYFPDMSSPNRIGVTLSRKGAEWWNESHKEEWLIYHDTMNQSPPSLPPGYIPAPVAMYTKKFYRINMEDPGKSEDPNIIQDELIKPATLGFGLQSVVSLCEKPKNVNIVGGENLFSDGINPYELGVRFDYETGMCRYTKKYCDRMGLDFKTITSREERITDCEITQTQEVFETIFGTTMTRNAKREFQEFEHKWKTGDAGEKTLAVLEYVADPLGIGDMTVEYAEKLWDERREAFESGDPSDIALATFQTITDPLGINGKIIDTIISIPQVENALNEAGNWTQNNVLTPMNDGLCTASTEYCKFTCDADNGLCQAPCVTALGATQLGCDVTLGTCLGACNTIQGAGKLACTVTHGICTGFDEVVPLDESCKAAQTVCNTTCDGAYGACVAPFVTVLEGGIGTCDAAKEAGKVACEATKASSIAACETVRGTGIAGCTVAQACYAGCAVAETCYLGCDTIAACDAACEVPAGTCVAGCATSAGIQTGFWEPHKYDDIYNACKNNCFRDLGVNNCKNGCSQGRQNCENGCNTATQNCRNGCDTAYRNCESEFNNAYNDCTSNASGVYNGCFNDNNRTHSECKAGSQRVYDQNEPTCATARTNCKGGCGTGECKLKCDQNRDQCNADVDSTADGCKRPCNSVRDGCNDAAETVREDCIGTCEQNKQSCRDSCNTMNSACRG